MPGLARALTSLACCLLVATGLSAQNGPPQPSAKDKLLARFRELTAEQRDTVLGRIERRLSRETSDLVHNVMGRGRKASSYPEATAPEWFLSADYAPVAGTRRLLTADESRHRSATNRIRAFEFLPDLHRQIDYDWRSGKAVRRGAELSDEQRFANLLHGYFPNTDHAVAQVLAILDDDPQQKALGEYFEHLYGDRYGNVFAGVRLFDAWNAGIQLEMPDTDVIAFARRVLKSDAFTSPIPEDRRRDDLYQKMREAFESHRGYRTLRLAAAAAFVAGDPKIEPTYQPLVARCHWLWIECDYDPERMAERLRRTPDRARWISELDAAIKAAPERVEPLQRVYRDWGTFLMRLAEHEVQTVGD